MSRARFTLLVTYLPVLALFVRNLCFTVSPCRLGVRLEPFSARRSAKCIFFSVCFRIRARCASKSFLILLFACLCGLCGDFMIIPKSSLGVSALSSFSSRVLDYNEFVLAFLHTLVQGFLVLKSLFFVLSSNALRITTESPRVCTGV